MQSAPDTTRMHLLSLGDTLRQLGDHGRPYLDALRRAGQQDKSELGKLLRSTGTPGALMRGSSEDDNLSGDGNDNLMIGGDGDDKLYGNARNDTLMVARVMTGFRGMRATILTSSIKAMVSIPSAISMVVPAWTRSRLAAASPVIAWASATSATTWRFRCAVLQTRSSSKTDTSAVPTSSNGSVPLTTSPSPIPLWND